MLPTLDPIPQALIQSMTRTLMFAADEQAMRLPFNQGPFDAKIEPVGFCVFTRSQMRLYTLRERLFHLKVSWNTKSFTLHLMNGTF